VSCRLHGRVPVRCFTSMVKERSVRKRINIGCSSTWLDRGHFITVAQPKRWAFPQIETHRHGLIARPEARKLKIVCFRLSRRPSWPHNGYFARYVTARSDIMASTSRARMHPKATRLDINESMRLGLILLEKKKRFLFDIISIQFASDASLHLTRL
jgi:hypothetical protein